MTAVQDPVSRRVLVRLVTIVACIPATAMAQGWHGSVALTSDYVFRGISQTQGDGAAQGDLHYEGVTGWFAGLWASSIDMAYGDYGQAEVNLYAGWNIAWDPGWAARVVYVRYLYPDAASGIEYDYADVSVRLAWRDRVLGTVAWSPDLVRYSTTGYRERGNAFSFELGVRQPLGESLAVNLGGGYYDQPAGIDYSSWKVGLTWQVQPFELELSRFASDGQAEQVLGDDAAGDRWVVTALWRF